MTDLVQWNRNGDHPADHVGEQAPDPLRGPHATYTRVEGAYVRFFRHPDLRGDARCPQCRHPWDDHGWIDNGTLGDDGSTVGITVHPGDWLPVDTEHSDPTYQEATDRWASNQHNPDEPSPSRA